MLVEYLLGVLAVPDLVELIENMPGVRKWARVSGAECEALQAALKHRYAAGESLWELAFSAGRSYGFVHRLL